MRKLLIIDDKIEERQDDYLDLYSEAIEQDLYTLQFAESGEEGLKILKQDTKQEICLILLDLRMDKKKIDGIKLANSLNKHFIKRPILVYTAYPDLASKFSKQAQQNVITVIERSTRASRVIKDLVDVFIIGGHLEVPGDTDVTKESKSVGYHTIRKLVKTLSHDLRVNLIKEILPFFPPDLLVSLKKLIPEEIDKVLNQAVERDILKTWLKEQQLEGFFKDIPPVEEINDLKLEIRDIPQKNGKIYQYHFLRWSECGKFQWKYIRKQFVRTLPPELQKPDPASGDLPIVFRSMKRKEQKASDYE